MDLLTPDQVRALRDYLENHGLTYESLQTEMLDHICCDVEVNMEKGLEFEKAIEKVISKIPENQLKKYKRRLWKLQTRKLNLQPDLPTLVLVRCFLLHYLN